VSQNFLTSKKTIDRLIRKTSIGANDHVIEIGPGKGHITDALLRRCKKLSAVELDGNLYRKLLIKYSTEPGSLKLHHHDFLKWSLPQSSDYKVFANIPFCRTTDIVRKLTESTNPPQEAWLVMEKGAAKRFIGMPQENLRSLPPKPQFDINIIYHFKRDDFHPAPNVDVVMLHLKRKSISDVSVFEQRKYQNFISNYFSGKEKFSKRAALLRMFTKRQLSRACKQAGVNDLETGEILRYNL